MAFTDQTKRVKLDGVWHNPGEEITKADKEGKRVSLSESDKKMLQGSGTGAESVSQEEVQKFSAFKDTVKRFQKEYDDEVASLKAAESEVSDLEAKTKDQKATEKQRKEAQTKLEESQRERDRLSTIVESKRSLLEEMKGMAGS